MKEFKFTIRGNEYAVEVKNVENNVAEIEVNGSNYKVELHAQPKKTSKTPRLVRSSVPNPKRSDSKIKKTIGKGAKSIKAPLPGTVLELFAKEGQEVKKGDKLLIMEAMKMENNILAEADGKIAKVNVSKGDSVLQDEVLIEIE